MQDVIATAQEGSSRWTSKDTAWTLNLFGTAVGAGILFLPINAGIGGIWPLIIMTLLIGPMTFLSHRGLSRFCLSTSHPTGNITDAATEHFGQRVGKLITFGYFCAIFPILLIYGIAITNTVGNFMLNELHLPTVPRALLSITLICAMVAVIVLGEKPMLKVVKFLVYPLIIILLGLSVYLIPEWSLAQFHQSYSINEVGKAIFLTIPVLVFAFNHSPAISSFTLSYKKHYSDEEARQKTNAILKLNSGLLLVFVMFFVFSCVLAMSPAEMAEAKAQNLPVLSVFANHDHNVLFSWLASIVAIIAIITSFFGHFLGTREGLNGIITQHLSSRMPKEKINHRKVNLFTVTFIILASWAVAYANISIMNLIETVVAPIIAIILYIMPVIAVHKIPALAPYRKHVLSNVFIVITGSIAIAGFIVANLL